MPSWFTNVAQRLWRAGRKTTEDPNRKPSITDQHTSSPPSNEATQNGSDSLLTDQRSSCVADKTLGDVFTQNNTPEVKKECGLPLLPVDPVNVSGKETDNQASFTEPPSLDPRITDLLAPPVDTKTGVDSEPARKSTTKRQGGFKRWFGAAKEKYLVAVGRNVDNTDAAKAKLEQSVGGGKPSNEAKDTNIDATERPKGKDGKKKEEKKKRKFRRRKKKPSETKEHLANESQMSFQVTASGIAEPVDGELSEVCESQKMTDVGDTTTDVLVHNLPQLHRSTEEIDLCSPSATDNRVTKIRSFRHSVRDSRPNIQQDSKLANTPTIKPDDEKQAELTVQPMPSIKKDQESQCSFPPAVVVGTVDAITGTQSAQPPASIAPTPSASRLSCKLDRAEQQGGDNTSVPDGVTRPNPEHPANISKSDNPEMVTEIKTKSGRSSKANVNKGVRKVKRCSTSISIGERVCSLPASKHDNGQRSDRVNRTEKRFKLPIRTSTNVTSTSENTSTDSRDSSWCRRICEEDKRLRRGSSRKGTDRSSSLPRNRSEREFRNCRNLTSVLEKYPTRSARHSPRNSPNQCVNVLLYQADNMIEELIDQLAWDMANAIVTRASYARTLSSRSNKKSAMLLRALIGRRKQHSAEGSMSSLPYLQCSRDSTPLVD